MTQDFIDGKVDRFGNDTVGTKYEALVQGGLSPEEAAAYFDENALDPYELANAKANV